ncbi:heavy metal translocating P-type ATPase [beta proteobacterium MWH-UniP1]
MQDPTGLKKTQPCFHCGEPVPPNTNWQVTIAGTAQPMCCVGCQAIATAIVNAGAENYYQQRTSAGLDVTTLEALAPWASLLEDPEWAAQHVQENTDSDQTQHSAQTTLAIEGLRCGACAWLIEKILAQTPGVLAARANASTARLFIKWQPAVISLPAIAKRVAAIGYALLPIGSAPLETSRRSGERTAIRRLFVAGLSSAQIMMYAYPEYLEGAALDDDIRSLMRTASMLITVPVMVYSATPFFSAAWRMLQQRRLGMDVPVSLGLIIAFTASMWAWWTNTGEVYFDSVSMFVFLLLGARWVESKIRARTSIQREKLATAIPTLAHRISPNPGSVAAWNLQPGDLVRVQSGDRIPADGLLQSASTDLDNAWLTGESLPVSVHQGERVTEGAINLGPTIEVAIDTRVSDGTLSRLSRLAEEAASDRPKWVAWADRIGSHFTAGILLVTLALVGWSVAMHQPTEVWLASVIAVLVVTCPCALSMAGPAAYAAALARLLELGVAVSSSQTLERVTSVTDVVFDKTGTLTDPSQSEVHMVFGDPDRWPAVHAIAHQSQHPLAVAIAQTAAKEIAARGLTQPLAVAEQAQLHAGLGVAAHWQGQQLRLGSRRFTDPLNQRHDLPEQCTVFLSIDEQIVAGFSIEDTPRPESHTLMTRLRQLKKTIWCLSGDQAPRVTQLAQQLAIDSNHALAQLTPDAKQKKVQEIQANGAVVLMVGDGHNDAPVLAQADVSIAVHSAAPLAKQKADIYLLRSDLMGVVQTLAMANRAKRILNQNLAWALAYNIIAIPFAAAGMISPLVASIGMACSSLLVVLNSARLLKLS